MGAGERTDGHREDSPTGAWGETSQAANRLSPGTLSPRPLADAAPRRAPDPQKSEAGARGRPSQGEGSAASADLEAGATRQGAGVSPDG